MGSFFNLYFFGQFIALSAIYITAAAADSIIIKAGEYNLGGEGQIYAGGFTAAILLIKLKALPAAAAIPLAFLAAFTAGAIPMLLSSLLKKLNGAIILLTSFLFSAATIPLVDGLITGIFRTKQGNLLSTEFIQNKFRFIRLLPPSSLNPYIFVSIIICLAAFYLLYKTDFGQRIRITGKSQEFARYSGYNTDFITLITAVLSGGLHGIAGAAAVCGNYYTCHLGFYSGMGWNALAAALIAGANPARCIYSGIFMAFIICLADRISLLNNFNFDISSIIQAVILIVISIPFTRIKKNEL